VVGNLACRQAKFSLTEGNPPGRGAHDNGDVSPGGQATFTITAATVCVPTVYLDATHGETKCAVFVGPMKLANGSRPLTFDEIVDTIRKLFSTH